MEEKIEFKIVGSFTWKQARDNMIQKLEEITTEDEFIKFFAIMSSSMGSVDEINATRKKLNLPELTEEEINGPGYTQEEVFK